jgi:hypothetical protein
VRWRAHRRRIEGRGDARSAGRAPVLSADPLGKVRVSGTHRCGGALSGRWGGSLRRCSAAVTVVHRPIMDGGDLYNNRRECGRSGITQSMKSGQGGGSHRRGWWWWHFDPNLMAATVNSGGGADNRSRKSLEEVSSLSFWTEMARVRERVKGGKWRQPMPFKGGTTIGNRGAQWWPHVKWWGVPGFDRRAVLDRQCPGADGRRRGWAACLGLSRGHGGWGSGREESDAWAGWLGPVWWIVTFLNNSNNFN